MKVAATEDGGVMAIKIKSNHQWRDLVYRADVPAKVLADRFSHLSEDDADGFFQYRGWWYHVSDFIRCEGVPELNAWHGYAGDSYFSGVVMSLSRDGERYMVGTYFS
jgi:hypothetical protein